MGSRLAQRGERPSLILTSTAIRARATARLVANELNYPWEFLQSDPALYHAAPSEIRSVIAAQDDSFAHILVVGHNPGFTELAQELIPGWDVANVPTSGVVAIQLAIEHWADVGNAEGQLRYFDFPKNKAPAEAPPD